MHQHQPKEKATLNAIEKNHPPHDEEAIAATAAAWLVEQDEGLTPAAATEFADWRRADPRHQAAVARLETTWSALQQLHDFRPEARAHPDRDLLAGSRRARVIRFPLMTGGLAAAAAVLLAAVWWYLPATVRDASDWQTYGTTDEGYQRVTLIDGSLLELNSATEVKVAYSTTQRQVRLLRGEAYFTVAKNPDRPFIVEAGTLAVRAVGTAFNVRLGAKELEVMVTEGKVQMARHEVGQALATRLTSVTAPTPGSRTGASAWLLAANERALIALGQSRAAPVIDHLAPETIREVLAWQGARLVFSDTPLAEAIAQFNRYNRLQIVLGDPRLGALPIGGSFRSENVEAFVRLLATDNGIVVERIDGTKIILHCKK